MVYVIKSGAPPPTNLDSRALSVHPGLTVKQLAISADECRVGARGNALPDGGSDLFAAIETAAAVRCGGDDSAVVEAADHVLRAARRSEGADAAAAYALDLKGGALSELGRHEQAIDVFNELLSRFADADDPYIVAVIRSAHFNKAKTLARVGQWGAAVEEAGLALKLARDMDANDALLARSLEDEAWYLAKAGRPARAIHRYRQLFDQFSESDDPEIVRVVCRGTAQRVRLLSVRFGRVAEALAVTDDLISRYANRSGEVEPTLKAAGRLRWRLRLALRIASALPGCRLHTR